MSLINGIQEKTQFSKDGWPTHKRTLGKRGQAAIGRKGMGSPLKTAKRKKTGVERAGVGRKSKNVVSPCVDGKPIFYPLMASKTAGGAVGGAIA